jgi:D-alanine-D-alanine ligase
MTEPHASSSPSSPTGRKPRVAVLFGGRSSEHAISCVTAGSVLAALDPDRYDAVPIGIARDGRWVLETGDASRLSIGSAGQLPEVDAALPVLSTLQDGATGALVVHEPGAGSRQLDRVDVVFPVLHGPWGEDGTVQGLMEMADVRYVGSGVLASAVGMDKHFMKAILETAGLPVLPYVVVTTERWRTDPEGCRQAVDALGYPVFVKPARGGSSIGISKVRSGDDLPEAIAEAQQWDPKVVVEAWAGEGAREIECGVLDGFESDPPQASPVAEITVQGDHDFYDFQAKYMAESSTTIDLPADVDAEVVDEMQRLAVSAFEALECEGLARVDFFLRADGSLVVNEINTMPGFTPTSMFPRMWMATGMSYADLVDHLVQLALRRSTGLR